MSLAKLSVINANKKYINGDFSAVEMVNECISNVEKFKEKNAVIEVFSDVLDLAKELDEKRANGEKLGKLAGVVVTIKDNILYNGKKATASSNFMKNFVATYTATALQKIIDEDAIVLGRTNMDEFTLGSNGESSIYGASENAIKEGRIAGGSSGGSAVAVALDMCAFSLASDTGGSARKPAIYNGVCGVKPTYGMVSRHGLYTNSASFDQIAPITKTAEDLAYVLSIIAGNDPFDMTTTTEKEMDFSQEKLCSFSGVTFGVEKSLIEKCINSSVYPEFNKLLDFIKQNGGEIKEIEIDNILLAKDVYDLISCSEIASGFARYDGLKYTTQTESPKNVSDLYKKSRKEGFGSEVRRRIMLGNYVLSQNKVYHKAKDVQQVLINGAKEAFSNVDALILPTAISVAPKKGEVCSEEEALLNVIANVMQIPSVSIPFAFDKENMPYGVSIFGDKGKDGFIINLARLIEEKYVGGDR